MPHETSKVMKAKAARMLEKLRDAIYRPVGALAVEAWVTAEPVPYAERMQGRHVRLAPGDRWGNLWDCAWFRFEGVVPEAAAGQKVVLLIDVNGELCLVDEEGEPQQGLTNVNSEFDYELGLPGKRVVDVTPRASGGERIELWADAGCNDLFGRYRSGTLKEADIAICDEDVRRLYYDVEVLLELADHVPESSARRARIERKLYEAANALAEVTPETVRRASELLAPELARRGGDAELRVSAIGHAHIDLAWLWPIRETIRKGARTFATALRNMEKYPDYVFGASQPQLYEWMKERHPKLYERIKQRVREGRWEVQGAMWVEPDTNISGGEALVRQLLYGKRFFREEFGEDVKTLWLPDVFGYTASLPQLLASSGVSYMMTQKLSWNTYTKFPHHSFIWEGIDGTGVLAHLPPEDTYNSPAAPRSLAKIERDYLDKAVSGHALMLFGIGDGGGGPGEEHLERLQREKNLSGLPPVVQEKSSAFFRRLEQEAAGFARYRGELYLEKHQGTLTSQARNKRYNRLLETELRELEFAASLALALGRDGYPAERIERIWKEVLLYQFHDILPGSSIGRVYEESLARYEQLLAEVRSLRDEAYAEAAARIGTPGSPVVFNSLPWEREDWVEWDGVWHPVRLPAMGGIPLDQALRRPDLSGLSAGEAVIENARLRVAFAPDGSVASIVDKRTGREALRPGARGNVLTVYHDDGDAWDFPRDYRDMPAGEMRLEAASYFVEGHRAVAEHRYRFGASTLTQRVSVTEHGRSVVFDTEVDWRESGKMLRTSFPTSVKTETANCEIQFGYLQRPTTRNTIGEMARDEVCAHRYIDLSEPDFGVALLNDGKYGHRAADGELDLHLLRSPSSPDPEADRAAHRFRYALLPHEGDFIRAGVYRDGYELNVPPVMASGRAGAATDAAGSGTAQAEAVGAGETAAGLESRDSREATAMEADEAAAEHGSGIAPSGIAPAGGKAGRGLAWIVPDHPHVMIEAVKQAEDSDDVVIRLYESAGARAEATIRFGLPCLAAEETNLLEETLAPLPAENGAVRLAFRPFEIKTLRIRVK